MSRFSIIETPIEGLKVIERKVLGDSRGFLSRMFCADELSKAGWTMPIAQINHTFTAVRGTVRGMHFQYPPDAEMKLVTCIKGEIFDVAVDLRKGSPTFLKWHAVRLSSENGLAFLIPEGFAHGFQTLSDNVEIIYCHSAFYAASSESGLNPMDPVIGISWPIDVAQMSERDLSHKCLCKEFEGVQL